MLSKETFEKYKTTKTKDIYLSDGIFPGSMGEREELSAFIKELLTFFIPNHNISMPENELREILGETSLELLFATCCKMYQEELMRAKEESSEDVLAELGLENASDEDKLATLTDVRDLLYMNYFRRLLESEEETKVIEALRKAFAMDQRESLLSKDHAYDFFSIAFKNFVLNKEQGDPLIKIFKEVKAETIASLKETTPKDTAN
jgi:hypothetical protein